MAASPSPSLYRTVGRGVILAILPLLAVFALAQFGRPTVSKGPRALGLLELAPNGRGHLIPIAIMVDGEFYDASVYKASPVPMALDSQTVYEAEQTGKSIGLFTVTGALQGANDTWIGAGKLRVPSAAPPKKKRGPEKPRMDDDSGPPKLKRPGSDKPAAGASTAGNPGSASGSSGSDTSSESKPQDPNRPVLIRHESQTDSSSPQDSGAAASQDPDRPVLKRPEPERSNSTAQAAPPDDPNRPRLRRGVPPPSDDDDTPDALLPTPVKENANKKGAPALATASKVRIVPAISDAGGPEPRSFAYEMKPDEEQALRKKALALATKELLATVAARAANSTEPPPKAAKRPAHGPAPQPNFENVQLHVFDLTSSNEPVLVLSARATLPRAKNPPNGYAITLVARSDIYGDLHKALAQITDDQHLDVTPRYELIDAVDADGDGRGDLLFRRVSDQGKSFAVYRVIGDQLWPLFEGTGSRD